MPDSTRVLSAVRDELETAGIIRRPVNAGVLPALHVEPRDGPPAPGERPAPEATGDVVATLRFAGEIARARELAGRRIVTLDVIYRSAGTAGLKAGRALDDLIRRRLVERPDYALGYVLGAGGPNATLCLEGTVYAGLGPVSDVAGVRTERAVYAFEVLAA